MNTTMNADHSKMRNPVGVPCWRGMLGCSPLPQTREVRSNHQGRFAMAHQPFAMLRKPVGLGLEEGAVLVFWETIANNRKRFPCLAVAANTAI
jgi:hypothetical protein